jgi:S-adenosylmethionine decarboxylase proenzyme
MTVGKHVILDLHDVNTNILQSITVENFHMFNHFIEYVLSTSKITLLAKNVHFFDLVIDDQKINGAFTALYLLGESHLSIHTWPERNYIAIDIFTCGECDVHSVAERISVYFEPKEKRINVLSRGNL